MKLVIVLPLFHEVKHKENTLKQCKWQKLILANGKAGCGKIFISVVMAADVLINKEINKIIVTRPILQVRGGFRALTG